MATITNQASLTYGYGTTTASALSNIATTTLQGALTVDKRALETAYHADEVLTYTLIITNSGTNVLNNVQIVDDLGTYPISATQNVTPLTYIGPANLYVNNVYNSSPVGTVSPTGNSVTFTIPTVAAGSVLTLQYKVQTNPYARLNAGTSSITNTATVSADNLTESVQASYNVPVDNYADVRIEKSITPNPIMDGGTINYTFNIENYGNTAANNIVLTDNFGTANPPSNLSVTINGAAFDDYTYENGVLTLPATTSSYNFNLPAATINQDPTSGEVAVTPSQSTVVVSGTIQ